MWVCVIIPWTQPPDPSSRLYIFWLFSLQAASLQMCDICPSLKDLLTKFKFRKEKNAAAIVCEYIFSEMKSELLLWLNVSKLKIENMEPYHFVELKLSWTVELFKYLNATTVTWSHAHSDHRFPAPSSKLCQIWLRH